MARRGMYCSLAFGMGILIAVGCGPRKSPREIEMGSNVEDAPSPAASVPAAAGDSTNAFPSIALDYPPPSDIPGIDGAETAAATDPKSASAALNLGYAYYKSAAYSPAVEAFEKAAALSPTRPEPLLFGGQAYMGLGTLDRALSSFTKLTALKNVSPDTRSTAYLQMGNCLFQQQKDKAAKAAFQKSVSLNSKQGAAKIALGAFAALEKQPAKAKPLFEGAIRDLPSSRLRAKAYASLGLLAEQGGNPAAALANYQKAIADDPRSGAAIAGNERLSKKPKAAP
ncbi:MAG: tetratricopeptide repeat protein [Cytophagales bacterium]|nr:tetratricopeptide repeat protein [Armatimonadota bacterium]